MNDPAQVVLLHPFSVSAERVFDAWLDATWLGRWMFGPNVRDERIVRLTLDPRVGGTFSFVVDRAGTEVNHVGEYLHIERPHRLVFTWGTQDSLPNKSLVTVEITTTAAGYQLKLTHEMSPEWKDFVDRAAGAWKKMLATLAASLTAHVAST